MAEDFSDLFDPAPPDFSGIFDDPASKLPDIFSGTGLGDIDQILGGQVRQQTLANARDPFFDPSLMRQQSEWEKAYERAQRRQDVEREINFEAPELDAGSAGLLGLQQGGYDLLRAGAGLADMARIPGARNAARWAGEGAAEIDDLTSRTSNAGGALQMLTRGAMSVIPTIATGFMGGGLTAMSLAAGSQSAGSVYEDAIEGYMRNGLSEGQASNKAYIPAIAAFLVTAGVTRLGGRSGVEALSRGLTAQKVSQVVKGPLIQIIEGAGKEAIEEAADQVGQAVIEKLSYNPEKSIGEAVYEVFVAGGLGGVLGGLGEVSAAAIRKYAGTTTEPDVASAEDVQAPDAPIDPNAPMGANAAATDVASESAGVADDLSDLFEPTGEADVSAVPNESGGPQGGGDPGINDGSATGGMDAGSAGRDITEVEPPAVNPEVETVGLRSGRRQRGKKALAVRVLTALGADERTAEEFMDAYAEVAPPVPENYTLEQFRQDILDAFNAAGMEPEDSGGGTRENAETFESMGYDRAQAEAFAKQAREENQPKREAARARNKQRMARLKSLLRSMPYEEDIEHLSEQLYARKRGHEYAAFRKEADDRIKRGENPTDVMADIRSKAGFRNKFNDPLTSRKSDLTPQQREELRAQEPSAVVEPESQTEAVPPATIESGRNPEESIKALRQFEEGDRMPEGRPLDKRERAEWLMDQSTRLARGGTKGRGWTDFLEANDLIRKIKAGEVAKVPENAAAVKIESKNYDVIIAPSVQPGYEGQWQASVIGKDGTPFSHSVHPTLQAALKDRVESLSDRVTKIRVKKESPQKILEGGGQPEQQQEGPQEGLQEQQVQGLQVAPAAQEVEPVAAEVEQSAPAAAPEPAPAPAKARTQGEEREYQELRDKKRLGTNQVRRLAVLEAMAPYEKKRRGPRQSWGDIIDYIEGHIGKIKGKKSARPGTEGYYSSAYEEAITKNALKPLFTNKGGSNPDEVVDDLRRNGYLGQDASVDDLWQLLLEAAAARKNYRKGIKNESKIERQMTDFADNALEPRKGAKPVNVSTLIHGDTFKVDGEEFEVSDMEFDEETDALVSVTLDDGNRFGVQIVGGNEVIYPDKGKVTSKPMEEVWNPESGTESPQPLPTTQDAEGQSVLDVGQGGQLAEIEGQDLDARQAQMRADMSTPMGAAPIQTQGDMLGGQAQENQDIPLFDQQPKPQADAQVKELDEREWKDYMKLRFETPNRTESEQAKLDAYIARQEALRAIRIKGYEVEHEKKKQEFKAKYGKDWYAKYEQWATSLGPINADEDEEMSIGGPDGEPSRVRRAKGTPGISAMIESSPLPANTKLVIKALMNSPLMKNADWDELRFELWDFIQTGVAGARIGRLIKVSEGANSTTFVHEILHIVYDFLPALEQSSLEAMRKSELRNFEKALRINLDSVLGADLAKALRNGELSSRAYMEQVVPAIQKAGFPEDDFYKFTNASEFMAYYLSEKFATKAFEDRNKRPEMWTRIKEWFQGVVDAIKRAIGLTPDMERLYRQVFSGVYKPDLKSIVEAEEEQASFVTSPRRARNNMELQRNQQDRETEASHQLAQSTNFVEFLTKHGASAATFAAQKALGFLDYIGIQAIGASGNNGQIENYQQLRNRITNPEQRTWLARWASVHIANWEAKLKKVIAEGQEAQRTVSSPAFQRRMTKLSQMHQKMDATKVVDDTANSILDSAYQDALKVLKEEAKNDLDIANAEGMVKELESAMKSSSAMNLLLNDMVNVISSTPAGVAALSNPNVTRDEIKKIYRDIKKSTGQPLFSESLMNWAAYILHRNPKLRDALWASHLSRNSSIRAQMGPYAKKFLADLEADPLKTLRRELRASKKRTSDFERARFAYLTLNEEVQNELEALQSKLEAGQIAEDVLNDPDFKGFRKQVFDDVEAYGTQKPLVAFADKLLVLPSGREVNLDPEFMKGGKQQFDQERAKYLAAVAELEQWLNNPANAYDPNYGTHMKNLGELQAYYTSMETLRPSDSNYIFKTALTILRDAVDQAGTRLKGPALKMISRWNEMKQKAGWWFDDVSKDMVKNRIKSLKSHNLKWSEYGEYDLVAANQEWWLNVGNLLAYSHNRQQPGFKVGDKLPSGWVVTQEDYDDLKFQSQAGTKGFALIGDDQVTEDYLWNIGVFRKAKKGSDNMVRRTPNEGFLGFSRLYLREREAFQNAFRRQDQAAMAQAEQAMIKLLDANWAKFDNGFAWVWDRSSDFANVTVFDGEGKAFDVISNRMLQNPGYVQSFDQLIDEVVSLSANVTRDEAKQILMVEIGQIIKKWDTAFKDEHEGKMVLPVRGTQSKNAATRARGQSAAPYVFYEYGFKDNRSLAGFSAGLHSRALDRVVAGLVAIDEELQRQIKDLANEPSRKQAIKRQEIARRNGQSYDSFKSLEWRRSMITDALNRLTTYDDSQDMEATGGRLIGAQTGMLVGQVRATARNFTTGPLYIGLQMNRILGSAMDVYPKAFLYSWWNGLKTAGNVGRKGAEWLGKKMTYNIADMARAAQQIAKGDFRGGFDSASAGLAEALGREALMSSKETKALVDAGLHYIPDYEQQRQNAYLGSLMYMGQLQPRSLTTTEKVLATPAMIMEQPLMFIRSVFPTLGDAALNATTAQVFQSGMQKVENRLKMLFLDWQKNPYRTFDFNNIQSDVNTFSAKEITPDSPDPEKQFLEMRKAWQEAGLSFDEEVTRFFSELNSGNKHAKLFTKEVQDRLISLSIDQVNRSSPAGSPLKFRNNDFLTNLFKPFLSWKARTMQMFNRFMSVAAQSDRSRTAQWMSMAFLFLLPLLLFNALMVQPAAEHGDRMLAATMHDMIKSSRHPWERDTAKSQAIGWVLNATLGIPGLDIAMNLANDLPVRASLNPDIAMLEKGKDIARWVIGGIMTGDPTFRMAEMIAGIAPDAKAFLNRMESQSGKRESNNIIALMRRHGNVELLRATGEPMGINYNELSPYGPKMENAALNGDLSELRSVYKEAVQVAKDMGRNEPEQAVRQLFSHRNPYDRAFKQKLTDGQRKEFLNKLDAGERELVVEMEKKFEKAADAIGANVNWTKNESSTGALSSAGRGSSSTSLRNGGRAGGLRRQDSGLRRNDNAGLRRRN